MKKSVIGIGFLLIVLVLFFIAGDYFLFKQGTISPDASSIYYAMPDKRPRPDAFKSTVRHSSPNEGKLPEKTDAHQGNGKDRLFATPSDREAIISEYREKLSEIKKNLQDQGFDFGAMREELRLKLKESENGRLSKEELLALLPKEVEKNFMEIMNLIMQLSKIENTPETMGNPGEGEI